MEIKYHKRFTKSFKKLDKIIQLKTINKIETFIKNPFDKSLDNHGLNGEYEGCRSIDITGDYRAIFKELSAGKYEFIEFINIGTHSQLY